MKVLNLADFAQQIQDMKQNVAQLQQSASKSSTLQQAIYRQQQQLEKMALAFQELRTNWEELQAANKELHQQNAQLSMAPQALDAERQRYQDWFELAPEAYLVTDKLGSIQDVNRAAARQFNILQQFLVGQPLTLYVIEEERQAFRNTLHQLCKMEGVHKWNVTLHSPNRTPFTASVSVTTNRDREGNLICLHWIVREITDRQQAKEALQKLAEELENRVRERTESLEQKNQQLKREMANHSQTLKALQQSEQRFSQLAANVPGMIYQFVQRLDGSRFFPYISFGCREILELEPEIIQENVGLILDMIHSDDRQAFEDSVALSYQTLEPWHWEGRFILPSGKVKWLQAASRPQSQANGDIVWDGLLMDITERKQALEALRESEERFRQLAENIPEIFWMVSLDRPEMIYVSPGYKEIWGKSCDSLYQQPLSWIDTVHPEDRDCLLAILENVGRGEYDAEYRIVRSDGSIRWIRDRGFPVYDAQGRAYRRAGIAKDITSHKQAELESYNALQRERELGELKSRFVAMTSHEFRTPLATIQSSAELLERYRDKLSQEKQNTHLQRIQMAVERMTQMLNDILLIGEAEAGKLKFNLAPLDLRQFCCDLVEELQQGSGKQHTIAFTSQCPDLHYNIDAKLLRHILSNLLSNAIKYSPKGTTIQFDISCCNYKVTFQIRDRGIGIPPEDLPHLFGSFHRAKNVGAIQGTGLGLAIVKQCVDLHQGEIAVTSEVGKGTTFTVTLPLNTPVYN